MQLENGLLPRGVDYLTTVVAKQRITIPPEKLGGGKEGFDELVTFIGAPLFPKVGNADTIMERLEEGKIGSPVKTRLVAFANVSAAPIRIQIGDDEPTYFDLYVTLSPTMESPGQTVFYSDDGVSGAFESEISLAPLFELRPLGAKGGSSIFIDTGITPIPGFPMRLGTVKSTWTLNPTTENDVRHFAGRSIFYTGEVMIQAYGERHELLAACAKRQAQLVDEVDLGRFARIDFPTPKRFTNLEINRWLDGGTKR